MRILLTGASGFIGRHLLEALLAEGHQVVCATRKPIAGNDPRMSSIHADFAEDTDKSVWLPRLADIDMVINAVGIFREAGGQTFQALHTDTPCALFAACAESGRVHTVIQLSALGADRDAASAYHLSKKAADDYLVGLPLRAYIVQPSLVYGKDSAGTRVFTTLASLPLCPHVGSAPQLVQPVHVDDVVAAITALVRYPVPVLASGDTARRIPLVGPAAMPFLDYLAELRRAMRLGELRVLPLPDWLARALAMLGRLGPPGVLDQDALRMLDRGNTASPAMTARLVGHAPRPVSSFITDPAAERLQAKLGWLLPVLRLSIAAVWIVTAIVSFGLFPAEESYRLLERTGIDPRLQPLMLYGAASLDLALGVAILVLRRRRWLWLAQLVLIGVYSIVVAWRLPEFLLHPYGPLSKNLPMLAAIWLLYELEER